MGHENWQSQTFDMGVDFSGALILKSSRAMFVRKKWPSGIIVQGRTYYFWKNEGDVSFLYKEAMGRVIRGRMFGVERGSRVMNLTEQVNLEQFRTGNESGFVQ